MNKDQFNKLKKLINGKNKDQIKTERKLEILNRYLNENDIEIGSITKEEILNMLANNDVTFEIFTSKVYQPLQPKDSSQTIKQPSPLDKVVEAASKAVKTQPRVVTVLKGIAEINESLTKIQDLVKESPNLKSEVKTAIEAIEKSLTDLQNVDNHYKVLQTTLKNIVEATGPGMQPNGLNEKTRADVHNLALAARNKFNTVFGSNSAKAIETIRHTISALSEAIDLAIRSKIPQEQRESFLYKYPKMTVAGLILSSPVIATVGLVGAIGAGTAYLGKTAYAKSYSREEIKQGIITTGRTMYKDVKAAKTAVYKAGVNAKENASVALTKSTLQTHPMTQYMKNARAMNDKLGITQAMLDAGLNLAADMHGKAMPNPFRVAANLTILAAGFAAGAVVGFVAAPLQVMKQRATGENSTVNQWAKSHVHGFAFEKLQVDANAGVSKLNVRAHVSGKDQIVATAEQSSWGRCNLVVTQEAIYNHDFANLLQSFVNAAKKAGNEVSITDLPDEKAALILITALANNPELARVIKVDIPADPSNRSRINFEAAMRSIDDTIAQGYKENVAKYGTPDPNEPDKKTLYSEFWDRLKPFAKKLDDHHGARM